LLERPSKIPGHPPLQITSASNRDGEFRLTVPQSVCGEDGEQCKDAYDVTILPKNSLGKHTFFETPPALAPPLRFRLVADQSQTVSWELGKASAVKSVHGCVKNEQGIGLQGLSVSAVSRLSPLSQPVRTSSRSRTGEDGCFDLLLSRESASFDILFGPEDPTDARPHIRWRDRIVPDGGEETHDLGTLTVPAIAKALPFPVLVSGRTSGGDLAPVPGSQVAFASSLLSMEMPEFSYQWNVSGESAGESGALALLLLPGRTYQVDVVPPSGSEFAASFADPIVVGQNGAVTLELDRRLPVQGHLRRFDGRALFDARLRADLSPSWLADSTADTRDRLIGFVFPSATTSGKGDYQIWLDQRLHGKNAVYDLLIEPPASSGAPVWSIDGVKPLGADGLDLGDLRLPDSSWARGDIRGPGGASVPGAQLQLLQLRDPSSCDGRCQPAPYARGTFAADAAGIVRVLLPDPPPPGAE
jgi:hypothetical protein